MNRTLLFTALLAVAGAAFASSDAPASPPDIDKVNGSITAVAGQAYGDLGTVNGSIRIENRASIADAETVNGSIHLADDVRSGNLSTVNGKIHVGPRARVQGGIETVNGGVFVDRGGAVQGSIETVNGAIGVVDTDLAGGIATVNGNVTVGVGSHVKGGIRIEQPGRNWGIRLGKPKVPRVVIGPGAVVEGPLVFEREVTLLVHQSARIGAVSGATARRFDSPTPPRN